MSSVTAKFRHQCADKFGVADLVVLLNVTDDDDGSLKAALLIENMRRMHRREAIPDIVGLPELIT
jgi:hypothetical protein